MPWVPDEFFEPMKTRAEAVAGMAQAGIAARLPASMDDTATQRESLAAHQAHTIEYRQDPFEVMPTLQDVPCAIDDTISTLLTR